MLVMVTNKWEVDAPKDMLTAQSFKFADDVKTQGIAELRDFLLAHEQKVLWCTWETDDVNALQSAFDDMNRQSGLISELTPVEDMIKE